MSKRVVVGLSGGVDSGVAAWMLREQGYEVIAIFMRNWHDESVTINNECPWIDDSNDAMLVAEHLGIPFQVLDLSAVYRERIVEYMFREYEAGRTPNPDVLCNREIKFDVFLQAALNLRADYVATGHYCRREDITLPDGRPVSRLLAGNDPNKDQSYFLCQLSQAQLQKALFPIGHLPKPEVRRIAREIGLPVADKKDSQGLCFIGKVKLPVFLQQQLAPKPGKVLEVSAADPAFASREVPASPDEPTLRDLARPYDFGKAVRKPAGHHNGAHFYTIGQRRGLGVGGRPEPLFIVHTDTARNEVIVGQGESHPALHRRVLFMQQKEVSWIREDLRPASGEAVNVMARIRYRQPLAPAVLHVFEDGVYLVFDEPQRGVAPGQFAAWYQGDEVWGSGAIAW
jgi:tRNA-uridine 2-sulfurtransferase